ncbi:hypothetical protein [Aquicella lusitana]|nr:hypothetical protein [Aquicella lusitana]
MNNFFMVEIPLVFKAQGWQEGVMLVDAGLFKLAALALHITYKIIDFNM